MVKITVDAVVDMNVEGLQKATNEAIRLGLRDTIVTIHKDVMEIHPWQTQTGNNSRSIRSQVSGMGSVAGEGADSDRLVDDTKNEAACFSTSGYGGFLETGTSKMSAKPYFRPALDRHKEELVPNIKKHLEE
jgi:HK97 gp10 family phage protein